MEEVTVVVVRVDAVVLAVVVLVEAAGIVLDVVVDEVDAVVVVEVTAVVSSASHKPLTFLSRQHELPLRIYGALQTTL